jgi:hypothetical protein
MDSHGASRDGRAPFDVRHEDGDYSGLNIESRYLENANLEKSFFNGVSLVNCAFDGVALNNCEFSEAAISDCRFDRCDLSAADFVDSVVMDTVFFGCTFAKGEWRGSSLRRCFFVDCRFDHTTMTLCTFRDCIFDAASTASIQHRAAYFNVFSCCTMYGDPIPTFASRNFGVDVPDSCAITWPTPATKVEELCQRNNDGTLRTSFLADALSAVCESLGTTRKRSSELVFFSRVVTVMAEERRISATSLTYLQQLVNAFAASITDRELLMSAMATVLDIHSALLLIAAECDMEFNNAVEDHIEKVSIYFTQSFGSEDVRALSRALSCVAGVGEESFVVEDVRLGSTFIEMTTASLVTTATLIATLNFVIRQATITVNEVSRFHKAIVKSRGVSRARPNRSELAVRHTESVQSLLQPQGAVPALARVREAVAREGTVLMQFDEAANVSVLSEESQRRRQ